MMCATAHIIFFILDDMGMGKTLQVCTLLLLYSTDPTNRLLHCYFKTRMRGVVVAKGE
jgi:SNF2 family DNA or RNA helicase